MKSGIRNQRILSQPGKPNSIKGRTPFAPFVYPAVPFEIDVNHREPYFTGVEHRKIYLSPESYWGALFSQPQADYSSSLSSHRGRFQPVGFLAGG